MLTTKDRWSELLTYITDVVQPEETNRWKSINTHTHTHTHAISNTGIESLSVEIPENIKMPNIITKAIEDYRQWALSKGHLYDIRLVAKSKDSLLFLEKHFKSLR